MALTPDQLDARRKGVGSSDIAAVMGMLDPQNPLNPYKGPVACWADKIGKLSSRAESEAMWWGSALEPVLSHRYSLVEAMDPAFAVCLNDDIVRHPEHDWCAATPDAFVRLRGVSATNQWGVELKTAFSYQQVKRWGKGKDHVPEEYLLQCQWCMFVTGLKRWDIAVLLATYHGAEFRVYHMEAHEGLHGAMFDAARRFWHDHVLTRVQPPATGLCADYDAMRAVLAGAQREKRVTVAMGDERGLLDELRGVERDAAYFDGEKRRLRAEVGAIIGRQNAEGIEAPGIGKVYARTTKKGNVTVTTHWESDK